MKKIIMGNREGEKFFTNAPTNNKFTCDAIKDREKKKHKYQKQLKDEIDRRNEEKMRV